VQVLLLGLLVLLFAEPLLLAQQHLQHNQRPFSKQLRFPSPAHASL
jgi:hypothetical protein